VSTSGPTPSFTPNVTVNPLDIDPLTGLAVSDPALLDRRPLSIKVSNLPRSIRPQWGLSLADIVFEYYTEQGGTRFNAIFLGNDASRVGPIRSARLVDIDIVRGYQAVFAFGGAYIVELNRLYNTEFADRLVVEAPGSPLTRYEPNGPDDLVVNTADLSAYATKKGIENGRQDLSGMTFNSTPPSGGQAATRFYVRYSSAIYNRWDYDSTTGTYLRSSDTTDDDNDPTGQNEVYAAETDGLTNQPLAFDNVVVLFVTNEYYSTTPEIMDIQLIGSGSAYAFRDGQMYKVNWQRGSTNVVSLTNSDGSAFPFKPGNTWFEIIGMSSTVSQTSQGLRFDHAMP
jgi:hypothetical protein